MRVPAHVLVALLGSVFGVLVLVCFLVFPLPPLPIQGIWGISSIVFSVELTVQCDGCLIQGLGWQAGLVAGLWVGQTYGVFHRPGFGLLVSGSRSLSTQTPLATQLLTTSTSYMRMKNFDPSHTCLPCFMGMMEHFFGFNSKLMSLIAA